MLRVVLVSVLRPELDPVLDTSGVELDACDVDPEDPDPCQVTSGASVEARTSSMSSSAWAQAKFHASPSGVPVGPALID